ncbi:MAG: hypothetical protein FWF38_08255, partial [Spirochaetaceae bacterium]|nr:hypothetical protein [Spirochaetaceae bacterium]
RNQKSEIRNQKSEIRNQKSEIIFLDLVYVKPSKYYINIFLNIFYLFIDYFISLLFYNKKNILACAGFKKMSTDKM